MRVFLVPLPKLVAAALFLVCRPSLFFSRSFVEVLRLIQLHVSLAIRIFQKHSPVYFLQATGSLPVTLSSATVSPQANNARYADSHTDTPHSSRYGGLIVAAGAVLGVEEVWWGADDG